jgi:hypothetical protein
MRFIAVIALSLLAAGCTQYSLIQPQRVVVKDAFSVEPDIAWNRINVTDIQGRTHTETWTADGPLLNALTFFAGIEDGNPLFRRTEEEERRDKLPAFRSTMNSTDIMELVEASYAKITQSSLTKTRNLRPAKFADADGFRFEMSFVGKDEVDREATAAGVVRNGKLYMILYHGARLHHHELRRPQAERIIESVRFQGT